MILRVQCQQKVYSQMQVQFQSTRIASFVEVYLNYSCPCATPYGPKKRRLTLASKLAISICSGLLGVSFMLCILYICWYRKTEKDLSSVSLKKSLLKVSYQTLLKATDGFSSGNLIGVGSFGSVYRGILEHDGTIVAVKVLNLQRHGASKSFLAECKALRKVKHRNLVKVLTTCSGVDYQGNDFKALVYDFIENGSLDKWLHPVNREDELDNEPKKLSLHQILNISIDVACALDYLHHQCPTPIVHCDLKPSNVLLNNDMTGHVGDFGLTRFLPEATHSFSTNQGSSIGVRGSIGFAAPDQCSFEEEKKRLALGTCPAEAAPGVKNSRLLDFNIANWSHLFYRVAEREDEHQCCCSSVAFHQEHFSWNYAL